MEAIPARGSRTGRALRAATLFFLYYLVAAASFSGDFAKWAFRDDNEAVALPRIMDGTAARPFVYRRLVPDAVHAVVNALPDSLAARTETRLARARDYMPDAAYARSHPGGRTGDRLAYVATYYLVFLFWLAALFQLRRLSRLAGQGELAATLAPAVFALCLPLLMTTGGYYYDPPELFFLASAILLAARGSIPGLILVSVVATVNKETFLFFIPTLLPFMRGSLGGRARVAATVAAMLLAGGAVHLAIRSRYAASPGASAEWNLLHNLGYLVHPASYAGFEANYGVLTTRGLNLLHIALVAGVVAAGWRRLPRAFASHLKLALAVNVPLFLLFSWEDELRALSLIFPGFVALLAANVARAARARSAAESDPTPAGLPRP